MVLTKLRSRHAEYYLRLSEEQSRDVADDPVECVARLRQEARNLKATLEWLRLRDRLSQADDHAGYAWAALTVGAYYLEIGDTMTALPWLEQASAEFRERSLTAGDRYARQLRQSVDAPSTPVLE